MKKSKFLLILLSVLTMPFFNTLLAQNTLHYAWSTNGDAKDKLFPETDGKIIITNTINTDCTPEEIISQTENYILGVQRKGHKTFENTGKTTSRLVSDVEFSFGKQAWGMEFWGSPLFSLLKDATKVKFKLAIEAIPGKYRYILSDFETNRNTISGEAKNDGQSNTIHFQRVNSLLKERDAYAATHKNDRETQEKLYDYNAQIDYENYLYANEFYMVDCFAKGLDKLNCQQDGFSDDFNTDDSSILHDNYQNTMSSQNFSVGANGIYNMVFNNGVSNPETTNIAKRTSADPIFRLGKGNNVYITSGENAYEQSGAQELIKQIKIDGFWNVVGVPSQADFIITYIVNTDGRDKAYINISVPDTSVVLTKFKTSSNESVRDNREVARSIYLKKLTKLQKDIVQGKYIQDFSEFYNK